MKYPINWNNDKEIKRLFTFQTKIGVAPSNNVPIGWYQMHQDAAYQVIIDLIKIRGLKEADITHNHYGIVFCNGESLASKEYIYREAQRRMK